MGKNKRLLFILHSDHLKAGGELSLLELIKSAIKRNYQVYAVAPAEGEFLDELVKLGVWTKDVEYYWWGVSVSPEHAHANLAAVGVIARIIKEQKIDAVATNTLTVPWGALAAALTNTPHAWISRELPYGPLEFIAWRYEFISKFSNLLIANSEEVAKFMRSKAGLMQTEFFRSFVDEKYLRLNTSVREIKIVNIGSIQTAKNQLDIIRAAAELKKTGNWNSEILFIGKYDESDPYYKALKHELQTNNLQETVKFMGAVDDPYKYIGPNFILVQPSEFESIGRVITEAMKLGLVCVGADIPGTKEAFVLGGGILYKQGNHKDLAKKLRDVINNFPDYKEAAKKAQARALKNLSEEASHQPFFDKLEKIFGQPNPRKELGQLSIYFDGIAQVSKSYTDRISYYETNIQNYQKQLEDIVNSKGYKIARSLQKGRQIIKPKRRAQH